MSLLIEDGFAHYTFHDPPGYVGPDDRQFESFLKLEELCSDLLARRYGRLAAATLEGFTEEEILAISGDERSSDDEEPAPVL